MKPNLIFAQRGQALPLGIFLLLIAAAVMYYMFNSGQVTSEKMRITNTADAVAYSAGVYQARVLNYDAFTNRAMIANEIAIGQAVSLASWDAYIQPMGGVLKSYAWIPYVGEVLEAMGEILDEVVAPIADDVLAPAAAAAVATHAAAMAGLSASQLAMHGPGNATLAASRLQVMQDIARQNDPAIQVDELPLSDNFLGLTRRYESRADRARMADLVREGRDGYLRDRRWSEDPPDFAVIRVFGCRVGAQLMRRGSTEFIDVDGWKAMDTLALHEFSVRVRRFRISCQDRETSFGFGSAESEDDLDDSRLTYARSRRDNPRTSRRADDNPSTSLPTIVSAEIPAFYELSSDWITGINRNREPRATLAIRVFKSKSAQRYSGGTSTVKPSGALDVFEGAHQGNQTAAVSRVEVFFERPDGNNPRSGTFEKASLFNPYWQVRLMSSEADRAAAAARQGMSVWPF